MSAIPARRRTANSGNFVTLESASLLGLVRGRLSNLGLMHYINHLLSADYFTEGLPFKGGGEEED
jgi:hypothetical protein